MQACLADVFVMMLPGSNPAWLSECLGSLRGQPINLRFIDGEPGNIGRARRKGFALGDAKYVAYVDPDDTVRPGAFQACIDALEDNPGAVMAYTREAKVNHEGLLMASFSRNYYAPYFGTTIEPFRAHHLSVYRRSALPSDMTFLDDYQMMPEFALKEAMLKSGPFVFVDFMGYLWRQHKTQATKNPMDVTQQVHELRNRFKEALCRCS